MVPVRVHGAGAFPGVTALLIDDGRVVELAGDDTKALYVPPNFAHGFQTLQDNTEVSYHTSSYYHPASERGVRWDDPAFKITWPQTESLIIIARDREFPDFDE